MKSYLLVAIFSESGGLQHVKCQSFDMKPDYGSTVCYDEHKRVVAVIPMGTLFTVAYHDPKTKAT